MKKIIRLTIMLIVLLSTNLSAQKYMGNIHKYLFEEGVELLEYYKVYEQYQEYNDGVENPRYNKMREGSWKEDKEDWVYGYGDPYGPSVYISGVADLPEWIIENYLKTITHFWDADNFVINETEGHNIVSGYIFDNEYIVHNIPSTVTKAYTTLFGYNHRIHFKYHHYTAWGEYQQFQLVNGDLVWLWSLGGIFVQNTDAIISNNTLEYNYAESEGAAITLKGGPGHQIINNTIYNNTLCCDEATNVPASGISCNDCDYVLIEGNEICYGNSSLSGSSAISLKYCDESIIRKNLVGNNTDAGITIDMTGNTEIVNCTINNNSTNGIWIDNNSIPLVIRNLIITNNGESGIIGNDSTDIVFSDVWNNGYDGQQNYINCTPGVECIELDPLFVAPDNGDYSLQWNSENLSPCIDTGDPNTEWDADGTPPDMGAIPAMPHDYFDDQYDDHALDRVDWISFPVLNRITSGYTEALGLLQRQGLIDDDQDSTDDILDHVVYEDYAYIFYEDDSWHNNLPPDGDFHSYQGYKIVLREGYTSADIGISGMWEDESEPIQLYADKANWVGCYLKEPASLADAFESIWDEWTSIKSEHWAVARPTYEEDQIRGTVNPGELYIINVANDCELVWNESSPPVDPYIKEMTDYFAYEEKLDYMPILVDTVYGDTTVAEIGVFCEDECIGASKVNDGYPVQILAYTPDGGGNGELEFMLYYGGSKGKDKSVTDYRVYDSKISAYLEKPVYYDKDSYVKVRLNTSGYTEPNLEFGLFSNYPNPVHRGITNISFVPAKEATNTEIEIFNIKGQLVRELDCSSAACKNGVYTVSWDCKNENGIKVGSGIYFYKLTSGDKTAVKKMLVLD